MKILIVDDEANIREVVREYCELSGYDADEAQDGVEAIEKVKTTHYDCVILDVMMPTLDGFSACKEIKKIQDVPIIMLSARCEEYDKLYAFDLGIDDYVTKPFKLLELMSRVRALIRRSGNNLSLVSSDGIVIDMNNMTVKKNNETIFLTKTEFQILCCLIRNSGVIVTRDTLLKNIWDESGNFIYDNTLSVHMSRLREKIGFEHIVTVRGVGYRWEDAR